jgi:hypothetical protein
MNQQSMNLKGTKRKRDSEDIMMSRISTETMCRVYSFALSNHMVALCREKKFTRLFPGESWYITLVRNNKELMKLSMLNEELFHVLLEKFFTDALNMLDLFNFFGYYVVKDMEKWLEVHEDDYESRLPFAVIPIISASTKAVTFGDYYLKSDYPRSMGEEIIFKCTNSRIKARYNFHVFDNNAKFVPLCDNNAGGDIMNNTSNAHSYCNSDTVYNIKVLPKNGSFGFSGAGDGQVVPVSPFIDLYQQQSKLKEASDYEFDVAYQASRPMIVLGSKPQKESKIDSLSEAVYFAMDDITGATQVDSVEKKKYAMQSIISLTNKSKESMKGGGGSGGSDGTLIRQYKHDLYQRADLIDGMMVLPEAMDVVHAGVAQKVIDTENLSRKLDLAICEVLKIPFQIVRPLSNIVSTASSSGSSKMTGVTSESQFAVYEKMMDKEIKRQQILVNRILNDVYSKTYAILDNAVYDYAVERQKQRDIDKKKKKKNKEKKKRSYYPSSDSNYGVRARIIFPDVPIYTNETLKLLIDAQPKEGQQDTTFITNRIKMNAGDDTSSK